MKSIVKRILRNLGLELFRFQSSPYEYIRYKPRYEENTVNLLGREFRIPDSVSFYASFREIFLGEIYKFESSNRKPIILDCGSNCGTSIVYYKSLYPEAKISRSGIAILKWTQS